MNKETLDKCSSTADKIINILDGMGFTTEKHVADGEVKALITTEIRRCLSDVVTDFYNRAALVPTSVIDEETLRFINNETNPKSYQLRQAELLEKFYNALDKLDKQNEQTNPNS